MLETGSAASEPSSNESMELPEVGTTAVPGKEAGNSSSEYESLEEQKQLLKVAMQIAAHGNAPEGGATGQLRVLPSLYCACTP